MILVLNSASISGAGTFGAIEIDGIEICKTVEREWANNMPNVSCIPAGMYRLEWHESPKYGHRLHVVGKNLGVTISGPSQRTHCLIHPANRPRELQGCIAVGDGWLNEWGVSNSRITMERLEAMIPESGCELIIKRVIV